MISADGFLLVFSCVTTSGFVRDMDKASKGQESFETSEIFIRCTNQIFLRQQPLAKIRRGNGIAARHTASLAYSLRVGTGRKDPRPSKPQCNRRQDLSLPSSIPLRPQFFLTKQNLRSFLHNSSPNDSLSFFLTSQFVSDKLQEYLSCFPLTLTSKIAS